MISFFDVVRHINKKVWHALQSCHTWHFSMQSSIMHCGLLDEITDCICLLGFAIFCIRIAEYTSSQLPEFRP